MTLSLRCHILGTAKHLGENQMANMPPEHATHAILYLMGEVHALVLFAQAVAVTNPDLLPALNAAEQSGLANLSWIPAQDEAVDIVTEGYRFAFDAILKMARGPGGNQQSQGG
jgi:hypothetical protein